MISRIWKIHIGIIIGMIITFFESLTITYISFYMGLEKTSGWIIPALFFSNEFIIVMILKKDFLTKECKLREKETLRRGIYIRNCIYRWFIKIMLVIEFIVSPIFWCVFIIDLSIK